MQWKIVLFMFVSMILSGNIVDAKERDPIVRILIKKGIITEKEIREMETEILKEESNLVLSTSEMQAKEKLSEDHGLKLTNKNKNNPEKGGDIKSLKYEVRNLHEEFDRLKSGKSLFPEPVKIGFGELKIGGLLQL